MGDFRILVDNLRISYEGPFQAMELFRIINAQLNDKGYDKKPLKEFEFRMPNGTYIEWQISPWKKISDHIRFELNIRIIISEMAKKEIVADGQKSMVDNGKVLIVINGYIESDYNHRWEQRAFFQFLRVLYDKYIYKDVYQRYEALLVSHANEIYALIQRHFNTYGTHVMRTNPNSIALHD